ncbi:MutS protein msh5 [Phlyctochytrium bullatum]|nr:MutS protein msh5 [Phlyctochytrium bullatum]
MLVGTTPPPSEGASSRMQSFLRRRGSPEEDLCDDEDAASEYTKISATSAKRRLAVMGRLNAVKLEASDRPASSFRESTASSRPQTSRARFATTYDDDDDADSVSTSRWMRRQATLDKGKGKVYESRPTTRESMNLSRPQTSTTDSYSVLHEFYESKKKPRYQESPTPRQAIPNVTEDDEKPTQSILAISFRKGCLGAAHFNPENGTLYLLEDVEDRSGCFDLASLLIAQIEPDLVLSHVRVDESFLDLVKQNVASLSSEGAKKCVEVRPATEFFHKAGINRLLSIPLLQREDEDGEGDERKRQFPDVTVNLTADGCGPKRHLSARVLLESIVSLDNEEMLGCAGALLNYIARNRILKELEGTYEKYKIRSIEQYSLAMHMRLNQTTLAALQIFSEEAHPNIASDRRKEGLSLFGIMNKTLTPTGAAMLRTWFMRPSTNLRIIEERLDTISYFIEPSNQALAHELRVCLGNMKNIPKILHNMKMKTTVQEWQAVLKIDFEESLKVDRVVVQEGVDNELDELKRMYNGLEDLLQLAAREVAPMLPEQFARVVSVVYFPQLGYLIMIPLEQSFNNAEGMEIEGLDLQFCTENTFFYKSAEMYDMDKTIGDIHTMIVDKEIEIVQGLKDAVIKFAPFLNKIMDICTELDCLLSLTEAARQYEYRRPAIVLQEVLQISGGRHPLQELSVSTFVANSITLGVQAFAENEEEDKRIMLLTGPNASGKSVLLKQIGLIVFMAQVGSFVPADEAVIGICDSILTRVQTGESVSKSPYLLECRMDILQEESEDASTGSAVTYLYKVRPGRAMDSLGLHCARLAGMSEKVVKRGFCLGKAVLMVLAKEIQNCVIQRRRIVIPPFEYEMEQAHATEEIMRYLNDFDCDDGDIEELKEFLRQYLHLF